MPPCELSPGQSLVLQSAFFTSALSGTNGGGGQAPLSPLCLTLIPRTPHPDPTPKPEQGCTWGTEHQCHAGPSQNQEEGCLITNVSVCPDVRTNMNQKQEAEFPLLDIREEISLSTLSVRSFTLETL